ncbi:aminopeptidase [Paracrocinitomix mangrovi]|uniref:aminopeptidase n=1 Tax=Paracrocinitomix mangrovi TaxID=2862509 RepID=UPI001C8D3D28|nr:aminopeptidase [Paracrocinitomix mangrovi]UKN02201.1 aminopeptidase [Paracrocinitomix mangrovi]
MIDLKGLEELVAVRSASGDEANIKNYILNYIKQNQANWKVQPQIIEGKGFQDAFILIFGKPTTAIFSHLDSIGFMVGYDNVLVPIGGPRLIDGTELVGEDSKGEIDTEMMVIEDEDGSKTVKLVSDRIVDRGTCLTFKPNYRESDTHIQSPYMDNRLGVWVALEVAKTLENGAIVFSTYEEHGGGSVGFLGRYLIEKHNVYQALISDITWVTEGILEGGGVAISMHDKGIPRRAFVNKIIEVARQSEITYQFEVESAGGSDGTMLQQTDLPFDWCFIGAPEQNVHTANELVNKFDIVQMVELYKLLMQKL